MTLNESKKLADVLAQLRSAFLFVQDHIEEVKNDIGGVVGYKLVLNPNETECLFRLLEIKP